MTKIKKLKPSDCCFTKCSSVRLWCAEKSEIDRLDVEKQCLDTIKILKRKIPELLKIKSLYDVNFAIW